jgi:hypothetical protein
MEKLKVSELQIHPLVKNVRHYQPNTFIKFSLQQFGQQNPIAVVKRNDEYFIIDGCIRHDIATEVGIEYIKCVIHDIPDEEIHNVRMLNNQKTKIHLLEKCRNVEHTLELIGSSQGKRHEILGLQNFNNDDEFGTAGKNRFEIACMLNGIEFSARTLRKLIAIYDYEKEDNTLGLIEGIDKGIYSIDAAYNLLKKEKKINVKNELKKKRKIDATNANVWCKVFEQSSVNLSNLKKYKPKFAKFSPTYWKMKEYRNQGDMRFGQEPTLKEYLENCRKFIDALKEIMDKDGVIVIVIGESYSGGYKSITAQYEMMLLEAGLEILGVCEWIKDNPVPVIVENFFRPANEKIFVCKMKGGNPTFNPRMKPTKSGKKEIKRSHNANDGSARFYLEDDETIITNIIHTPVFDDSEYKKYDPEFTHDAPCPMEIYEIFTETFTLPGDTCIDIHCGAGQGLEVFARHGCNAIGVDIDPVSVEFCKKRMDIVLGLNEINEYQQAA